MPTSSPVYPAHAFHAELPGGRASGELALTAAGFRFSTAEREVLLPFGGAQLTLGGASDRLVFVAHPCEPDWSIYTSDRSLLADPRLLEHPQLVQALGQIRRKRTRNLLVTLAALLLLVAVPLVVLFNLGVFTRLAARQVPAQWEEQLGTLALKQYEFGAELIADEQANRLLEQLTRPLTEALPEARYRYHFYIAREPELNAFALPGGKIVLHSELVLRADSAEELLGVLAHEISHVSEQHGVRNLIASAGLLLTLQLLIGDTSGVFGTLASAAPFLLGQTYSRSFEREADRQGLALLDRAQVDPQGLLTFFAKIQADQARKRERLGERAGGIEIPEFLSTHPTTESRISELRELIAAQQAGQQDSAARRRMQENLAATFAELKARVRSATESTDESKSDESKDARDESAD